MESLIQSLRREEEELNFVVWEKLLDKVAVFSDVQNLYYTVQQKYHSHFDYRTFLEDAISGRSLVKAIAYATDKGDRKQNEFQQILKKMGFEIKPHRFFKDEMVLPKVTGMSELPWI